MANPNSIPTLATQLDILEHRVVEMSQRVKGFDDIWHVLRDEIAKLNRRVAKLEERYAVFDARNDRVLEE